MRNFRHFLLSIMVVAMAALTGCAHMGPATTAGLALGGAGGATGAILYQGNSAGKRAAISAIPPLLGGVVGYAIDYFNGQKKAEAEAAATAANQQQMQNQQVAFQQNQRLQQLQSTLRMSAPVSITWRGQRANGLRSGYEVANVLAQIPDGETFEVATRSKNVKHIQNDFQSVGYYLVGQARNTSQKGIVAMNFRRAVPQQLMSPVGSQQQAAYSGL